MILCQQTQHLYDFMLGSTPTKWNDVASVLPQPNDVVTSSHKWDCVPIYSQNPNIPFLSLLSADNPRDSKALGGTRYKDDNQVQEEQEEERARQRRPWPDRQAPEAPRWSRKCWRYASPPHPFRQVPPWLLREGRNEVLPQAPQQVLLPHRQHWQAVVHGASGCEGQSLSW